MTLIALFLLHLSLFEEMPHRCAIDANVAPIPSSIATMYLFSPHATSSSVTLKSITLRTITLLQKKQPKRAKALLKWAMDESHDEVILKQLYTLFQMAAQQERHSRNPLLDSTQASLLCQWIYPENLPPPSHQF